MHIQKYCDEIIKTCKFFGKRYEIFEDNHIYKNAVSMEIFQIGELVKELDKFDKKFISDTKDKVPWNSIIKMRERFAHHYVDMDLEVIFSVAIIDIPKLNSFIKNELKNN